MSKMVAISELERWLTFFPLESKFISDIQLAYVFGTGNLGNEALFVMEDGDVYAVGSNVAGCLGLGNTDEMVEPKKVDSLCKKNIKAFAYGIAPHVLALSEKGEVYSWGNNGYGELGNNTTNPGLLPCLVRGLLNKRKVIQIACGAQHSLVLTHEGEVYAWGLNDCGQLGIRSGTSQSYTPTKVTAGLDGRTVTQIACGYDFTMCILDSGEVYAWGNNNNDKLGIDYYRNQHNGGIDPFHRNQRNRNQHNRNIFYPCKVLMDTVSVCQLSCGLAHTLALTDRGILYAWGVNDHGQLGVGTTQNLCSPAIVSANIIGRVIEIATSHSSNISSCVTECGEVYMWGECRGETVTTPRKTSFPSVHSVFEGFARPRSNHLPMALDVDVTENSTINNSLRDAFNDPETSDLQFHVEEKIIHVHKAFLKIRCEHFRKMFQKHWSENDNEVIDITQFSYITYEAFIKYLYTDQVDLSAGDALGLLELADSYCEPQLKCKCEHLIKRGITIENSAKLYTAARKYQAKELEDFCFHFAINHLTAVAKTEGFQSLSESALKSFLLRAADCGAFKH